MSHSPFRWRGPGVLLAGALVLGALAVGALSACSDDPLTQPEARDRTASAICDYHARCGLIGPAPASFPTRDACLTTWKGHIQGLFWPPEDCTHIVRAEYDMCVGSIQNLACGDGGDVWNSLAKCAKANVCGTP